MQVDTAKITNHQYNSQRISPKDSIENNENSGAFASILNTKIAQSEPTVLNQVNNRKEVDFTSMTRQEMFDWMNNQIRSGEMSLDDSSPFLGMTMKVSVATGEPVNINTDPTRINFVEKAQQGIDGAVSRNDLELVEKLQMAIELMQKNQSRKFNGII